MKKYVNLGLLAILALLVNNCPPYLKNMSNNMMFKAAVVLSIYVVCTMYDSLSGILVGLMLIVLLHQSNEGFTELNEDEEVLEEASPVSVQNLTDNDRKLKEQAELNKVACSSE